MSFIVLLTLATLAGVADGLDSNSADPGSSQCTPGNDSGDSITITVPIDVLNKVLMTCIVCVLIAGILRVLGRRRVTLNAASTPVDDLQHEHGADRPIPVGDGAASQSPSPMSMVQPPDEVPQPDSPASHGEVQDEAKVGGGRPGDEQGTGKKHAESIKAALESGLVPPGARVTIHETGIGWYVPLEPPLTSTATRMGSQLSIQIGPTTR